jgi:hypothetical protein
VSYYKLNIVLLELSFLFTIFKRDLIYYRIMVLVMVFNATFNNISVTSISWTSLFFMEENQSTWRNPPTCCKSLTNYITVHFTWAGFELTTLVVIESDCTASYKFNYHLITTDPSLLQNPSTCLQHYIIFWI